MEAMVATVPLLVTLALLTRRGTRRRGGQVLLVWGLLVTGLLVATGIAQNWDRAADAATALSDWRASADYRRAVAGNFFRRFWLEQSGAAAASGMPVRTGRGKT